MKIQEVNQELKDTKESLYQTLNDKISQLEVTKEELEQYKKILQEKKLSEARVEEELNRYHILKKIDFVINERAVHEQLDQCIDFLDKAIEHLK